MSYNPDRPDSWTDCSQRDFEEWYREKGHVCLEEEVSCGDTRRVFGCEECVGEDLHAHGGILCRGDCRWHQGSRTCEPLSTEPSTQLVAGPTTAVSKKGNIFFSDILRTLCAHFNIIHLPYIEVQNQVKYGGHLDFFLSRCFRRLLNT